jgi:hypothetical protein
MLHLSYYAYVFSSTKLEIRAEQVLPGRGEGRDGGEKGQRGEMTKTMYAHVNKCIIKNKNKKSLLRMLFVWFSLCT